MEAAQTEQQESGGAAIVLAAGKSTRMKSRIPKTLHPVCGRPILIHILDALAQAGISRRIVVVGHQAATVQQTLDTHYGAGVIEYALQSEQYGTGHAAQMAQPLLSNYAGTVLVVPGDTPLLTGESLSTLLAVHHEKNAGATLLTTVLPHEAGSYGRILRGDNGKVTGIVEAKDATNAQKALREINTSVYAFSAPALFRTLRDLQPNNAQGELYLTDVVSLLSHAGENVEAVISPDSDIVLGVNTRVELAEIGEKMRGRLLRDLMLSGVSIADPATTYVEASVRVGQDTVILPNTHLLGETVVGEDCVVGPNSHLLDAVLGDRVRARACFIEKSSVGNDCKIGPFAHIRPGSRLDNQVKIGNFVETKAAHLQDNVAAGHLTYIGDATVGASTNIGAGTITCNYDGVQKHQTQIGANVFVGSQTAFVAPVTVGDGAATGAGSVITKNVPAGALGIARERQSNKEGWAEARRAQRERKSEQAERNVP